MLEWGSTDSEMQEHEREVEQDTERNGLCLYNGIG